MLERDKGCRVTVETMEFVSHGKLWTESVMCVEAISHVPTKVMVVSFEMLLVDTAQQSGRIPGSLFDMTHFLKKIANAQLFR